MSGKVHISQVETLDTPVESVESQAAPEPGVGSPSNSGISEMKDMRDLSLMLGYDGEGFDGDYAKAMKVYNWGKEMAKFSEFKNPLIEIKNFTRAMGINSTKKALLHKLYLLTMMDTTKGYLYK